jgi:hypothetical protein
MDSTVERRGSVFSREAVIEIAGYIGAAVGLAAAGVVIGESASNGVQIAFDLITIAVLFGAGWALEPTDDAYRRMRSVLWFLSVFLVVDLGGALFGESYSNPKTVATLVALITAVYAFPLWWLSRRSLQVIALVLSVYGLLVALVFPNLSGFLFGFPDFTAVAMITWFYGIALLGVGIFNLATPRKTTVVLGAIFAAGGPLLLLSGDSEVLGEILALITAAALVLLGMWLVELAVSGLGIVGLLLASAIIVGNHVEDQGPAIIVLVIGLLLLAGAIAAARGMLGGSGPAAPWTAQAGPPAPPAPSWTPPPPPPETQGGG